MRKTASSRPKIKSGYLLAALIAVTLALFWASLSRSTQPIPYSDVQLAASRRMQASLDMLLRVISDERIAIQPEDINHTGLIGPEWTPLTSTLGMLEAKRTSLNPNFAALVVKYMKTAGLEAGDKVAFGLSGSFPGLCIAALSAASEMGLEALVIASYSSSMYGGTRPELSTVRMLKLLQQAGILSFQMLAVTPGSDDDRGENVMFPDSRELILRLAREDAYPLLSVPDIETSIVERLALYGQGIDCFVNVGGAGANLGTSGHSLKLENGLVQTDRSAIPKAPDRGLLYEYAARGVPVINLLNVRDLAGRNGLPFDPSPLPKPGEGNVYLQSAASPLPALIGLPAVAAILYAGWRQNKTKAEKSSGPARMR